jgi:hypothetical protein
MKGIVGHIAHDRLRALTNRNVLHRDLLLAAGPVAFERPPSGLRKLARAQSGRRP